MYKTVNWKTGPARARHNLKLKKKIQPEVEAPSSKLQAPSATKRPQLKSIVKLERNK